MAENPEQAEISIADKSASKKSKKKRTWRMHRGKRVMLSTNDLSHRSYLSQSRVAATGYKRKIRDLLLNNKSLAKALSQSESMVSKLEKELAQLQWQINCRAMVNMKLNQASGKLSGMATLLRETASIVMEAINCSLAPPIDLSLDSQHSRDMQNMTSIGISFPQTEEEAAGRQLLVSEAFAPCGQTKTSNMSIINEMTTDELGIPPICFENDNSNDHSESRAHAAPSRQLRSSSKRKSSDGANKIMKTPPKQVISSANVCETPKTPPLYSANGKFKSNIPKVGKIKETKKISGFLANNAFAGEKNSPVKLNLNRNIAKVSGQDMSKKKTFSLQKKVTNDDKKSLSAKNEHFMIKAPKVHAHVKLNPNIEAGIKKSQDINEANDERIMLANTAAEKISLFSQNEQQNCGVNLRRHTFVVKKAIDSKAGCAVNSQSTGVPDMKNDVPFHEDSISEIHSNIKITNGENENRIHVINTELKSTCTGDAEVLENYANENVVVEPNNRALEVGSKLSFRCKVVETPASSPTLGLTVNSGPAANSGKDSGATAHVLSAANSGAGTVHTEAALSLPVSTSQNPCHENVTIRNCEDMSLTEVLPQSFIIDNLPQNEVLDECNLQKDDKPCDIEAQSSAVPEVCEALEVINTGDKLVSPDRRRKSSRKRKTVLFQLLSPVESCDNDIDFDPKSFHKKRVEQKNKQLSTNSKKLRKVNGNSFLTINKVNIPTKKKCFVSLNNTQKKLPTNGETEKCFQPELNIFDFSFSENNGESPKINTGKKKSGRANKVKHILTEQNDNLNEASEEDVCDDIKLLSRKKRATRVIKVPEVTKEEVLGLPISDGEHICGESAKEILKSTKSVDKPDLHACFVSEQKLHRLSLHKDDCDHAESEIITQKGDIMESGQSKNVNSVASESQHEILISKKQRSNSYSMTPMYDVLGTATTAETLEPGKQKDSGCIDIIGTQQSDSNTIKEPVTSITSRKNITKDEIGLNDIALEGDINPTKSETRKKLNKASNPKAKKSSKASLKVQVEDANDVFEVMAEKPSQKMKSRVKQKPKSNGLNDPTKSCNHDVDLVHPSSVEVKAHSSAVKKKICSEVTSCDVMPSEDKNTDEVPASRSSKSKIDVASPKNLFHKNSATARKRNSISSKNISDDDEVNLADIAPRSRTVSTCSSEFDPPREAKRRRAPVSYKEPVLNSKLRRP